MATRAQSPPPPPLHLRPRLHASPLFSRRLPHRRCRGGRSRILSALSSRSSRSQRASTTRLEREPGPAPSSEQQQQRGDPALAAEIARLSGVRARLRGARTVDDKLRLNSNIVAATDLTLMALAGIGLRCNKDGLWSYGITCIEYTEFEKYGIPEPTVITGSSQVSYPANTNILYVDLQAVEEIGSRKNASCLPGMVLNLKKAVSYVDHFGFDGRV